MKVIAKDFTIPKQYLKQYQVLLSKSQTTIFSCKCYTRTQYVVFLTIAVDGEMTTFKSHQLADKLEESITTLEKVYKAVVHIEPYLENKKAEI